MKETLDASRVLYRDADCLVVNKKSGDAMEGAAKGMVDLPAALAALAGGSAPFCVHRLDVPVTGCALFALNSAALAYLNTVFAQGKAIKTYWAIVEMPETDIPDGSEVELKHWIEVDGRRNMSHAHREPGEGRSEARMRYRVLGRGDRYLFLEIDLITGRHHQIRAQLAAEGLRIKGDLKYGAKRSEKNGGIRLHARSLSFPALADPKKMISVTAEPFEQDALWKACAAARAALK